MSFELAEIDRRIATLLQAGCIEAIDYAQARCRVRVGDWVSAWLPWAALGAGQVRHWRPPSVGEQAVVLSPSGDPAAGFVLSGFYTTQHADANDNRSHTVSWRMPDGTLIEYDWAEQRLNVIAAGTANIQIAGDASVQIGGNANVQIGGWGQVVAQGKLLIKSVTRLILKGPSRQIIL